MGLRPKQGDFTGAIGMCQEERQGSVARALAFRASSIEVQHSVVKYPSLWGLVQRQHATLWTWKLGFESLIPSSRRSPVGDFSFPALATYSQIRTTSYRTSVSSYWFLPSGKFVSDDLIYLEQDKLRAFHFLADIQLAV